MHTPTPRELTLATGNQGKIREFYELLSPLGWQLQSAGALNIALPTELTRPEGGTLEGNARLKAEHLAEATQGWALADDSGLFVAALPDELGVDTATYGGPEKLLAALRGATNRQATFRCVLALAHPAEETRFFIGEDQGRIADVAQGQGGFGYDPVFIQDGLNETNALRIDRDGLKRVKGAGHRGRAIRALIDYISET